MDLITPYYYHPSGFVEGPNDSRYCPDCTKVVEAALENVPRRFSKKLVEDGVKYNLDEIKNIHDRQVVRRVFPGLYDLTKSKRTNHTIWQKMPDGFAYYASWWTEGDSRTEISIRREVWWDEYKNSVAENQEDPSYNRIEIPTK